MPRPSSTFADSAAGSYSTTWWDFALPFSHPPWSLGLSYRQYLSRSTYMVPTPINHATNRYPRLTYSLLSLATHGISKLAGYSRRDATNYVDSFVKREPEAERENKVEFVVFACLIPVLVLLSGLFAGLTLGYMSLDETQLHVLSISGTPYVPSSLHAFSSSKI